MHSITHLPQSFALALSILFMGCLAITSTTYAFSEETYICPMHPHIGGREDDTCPICGMTLVQKPNGSDTDPAMESNIHTHDDAEDIHQINKISIQKHLVQSLGVRVSKVTQDTFGKRIRAFGKIVPNTRLEYHVDAHSTGRIEKLKVNANGDYVKKGDLLYTYYSPDLITAQSDFLIGAKTNNAEQRLRLFGMDDGSIKLLKKKKAFIEEVPFHAPATGTITELNIRQGSHLEAGERVMSIRNYSNVWVLADVPLKDLQFLNIGDTASIIIPETGSRFNTVIAFIYPSNNPSTRTAQVRLKLDNSLGTLRPNTFVDVEFESTPEQRLSVPSEAILYSAKGAYVFIEDSPGSFQAIPIQVGITSEGKTEILGGLEEGQNIVISGQFMIDSESKIRGKAFSLGGHEHHKTTKSDKE